MHSLILIFIFPILKSLLHYTKKLEMGREKRWDIFENFPIFPIICPSPTFYGDGKLFLMYFCSLNDAQTIWSESESLLMITDGKNNSNSVSKPLFARNAWQAKLATVYARSTWFDVPDNVVILKKHTF
jgi:hypothetical protein